MTREDAYACDMFVTLPLKSGERALVVNQEDFEAWVQPMSCGGSR